MAMRYFVEFVVSSLVNHKEDVQVGEVASGNSVTYEVRLNPADIGRVIGKSGRTINSIRNLLNAGDSDKKYFLQIRED
jgi:predicted RNA-binding protein YlqC (UPF0109 family)